MTAIALQSFPHAAASAAIASPIPLQAADNAVRRSHVSRLAFGIHRDTLTRKAYRELLSASAVLPGTLAAVTFAKDDGTPRTMICQPLPEVDETRRYMTVWDVEVGDYRRVNLDGILKVTLETGAAARGQQPS